MTLVSTLPSPDAQADRLIALGLPDLTGFSGRDLRRAAAAGPPGSLLVVHPDLAKVAVLAPLLRRGGRPGFVVVDLADVDLFEPVAGLAVPDAAVYLLTGVDRGDHLAGWSPVEAEPAIAEAGRTPLLLSEGIQWLLHQPDALERNHCFMTIGSRLRKPGGLDSRTPALWISNGTGRDGPDRRDAPKVGWCWAGNRHTWLGFASARSREAPRDAEARSAGSVPHPLIGERGRSDRV